MVLRWFDVNVEKQYPTIKGSFSFCTGRSTSRAVMRGSWWVWEGKTDTGKGMEQLKVA
jgi:hypothetical protein